MPDFCFLSAKNELNLRELYLMGFNRFYEFMQKACSKGLKEGSFFQASSQWLMAQLLLQAHFQGPRLLSWLGV